MTHPTAPFIAEDRTLDACASLLDVLSDLALMPGTYRLTPDEPLTRYDLDTLIELLDAPGFTVTDWDMADVIGRLDRAQIVLSVRVIGGVW
jgi:hypothetical protein